MKRLRKDRKIPMRVVSEKTGLSHSHLSRIETGKATPTLTTIEKIATALGTSAAALLATGARAGAADTEYLKRIVASNLRQAREGRGLSRQQLAEPIGFYMEDPSRLPRGFQKLRFDYAKPIEASTRLL